MKKRIAILLSLAMVLSPMTPFAKGPLAPVTAYAAEKTAGSLEELQAELKTASAGDVITLKNVIYLDTKVTLNFKDTIIKAGSDFNFDSGDKGTQYLFTVRHGAEVKINNATIKIEDNNDIGAINVTLDSIANISTVTIDGGKVGINGGHGSNAITVNDVTVTNSSWLIGVVLNGATELTVGNKGLNSFVKVESGSNAKVGPNWVVADLLYPEIYAPEIDILVAKAEKMLAATNTDADGKVYSIYFENDVQAAIAAGQKGKIETFVNRAVSRTHLVASITNAKAAASVSDAAPIFKDALDAEITKAQALFDGDIATQNNVDKQGENLDKAAELLEKSTIPYASLTSAIKKAEAIVAAGDPATNNQFDNALTNAKNAFERTNAVQGTIDAYTTRAGTLTGLIDALVGVVNKDRLNELIVEFEAIVASRTDYTNYTPSVEAALDEAIKVAGNNIATQTAVEAQVKILEAIQDDLVLKADFQARFIADAEKLVEATITDAIRLYFDKGRSDLEAAITEYKNPTNARKEAQALATINAALASPSSLASRQPLVDAIATASDTDASAANDRYKEELTKAIGKAEELLEGTKNVTEGTRTTEIGKLQTAVDNIGISIAAAKRLEAVEASATTASENKELVNTLEFEKALKAATNALENKKTTIDKYNELADELETLMKGLEGVSESDSKIIADAEEATTTNKGLYFNPSLKQLETALDKYEKATAAKREDALTAVEEKLLALVEKAPLVDAIASATTAHDASKNANGAMFYITALNAAITKAEGALESNANETKRTTEIGKLTDAIGNLEKADKLKADLIALVDDAKKVTAATPALTKALNAATPNSSINLTKMQKQFDDLQAAYDAIVPVSKATLTSAITEAEKLVPKKAEYVSFDAVDAALATARTIAADDNATQKQVDDAVKALEAAIEKLVKVGEEPEKPIEVVLVDEHKEVGNNKVIKVEGSDERATVVIVRTISGTISYSFPTNLTIYLPSGATCYLVSLPLAEVKDKINGNTSDKSFEELFDGNIEDSKTNQL